MKKQIIFIIIILGILGFGLTGCSSNKESSQTLSQKVDSEIYYIDTELISTISKLNNIYFTNYMVESRKVDVTLDSSDKSSTSSKEDAQNSGQSSEQEGSNSSSGSNTEKSSAKQQIDVTEVIAHSTLNTDYDDINWDKLYSTIETFYTSWNTVILDLYKINVNRTDITEFSSNLDQLVINLKAKDKQASIDTLSTMYSYIPKYIQAFSDKNEEVDIAYTKEHILKAYAGVSKGDWNLASQELALAEEVYSNVMKNTAFVEKKEYNVNKSYVTLKELQTSISKQDISLFFLKYKNLMQEIDIL